MHHLKIGLLFCKRRVGPTHAALLRSGPFQVARGLESGGRINGDRRLVVHREGESAHPHDAARGHNGFRARRHLFVVEERAVGRAEISEIHPPLTLEKLAVFAADKVVLNPKLRLLATAKQDRQAHGKRPLLLDRRHNVKANNHDSRGGRNAAA